MSTDHTPESVTPHTGAERIAAERQRQIETEGYEPSHDALHDNAALAWAAACYAAPERVYVLDRGGNYVAWNEPWPKDWRRKGVWDGERKSYLNTAERVRELEKAGALIAAEIDRLLARDEQRSRDGGADD